MSVINSKQLRSTFVKYPFASTKQSCCCIKTCVELEAPSLNSTTKSYSKQKLLEMICSLEKQYNEEMENKQSAWEARVRELENTLEAVRQQSFELRQRSAEKTIDIDSKRERELLQRIDELEKQNANIISNKVSFIETNLTKKVHQLEHQLQCQKLQSYQELEKIKIELSNELTQQKRLTQLQKDSNKKVQAENLKLKDQLNRLNTTNIEDSKQKGSKITELERVNSCLDLTIENLKKQIQRLITDSKQKSQDAKDKYNALNVKYQTLLNEKSKTNQKTLEDKIEFQRKLAELNIKIERLQMEKINQKLISETNGAQKARQLLQAQSKKSQQQYQRRSKQIESNWGNRENDLKNEVSKERASKQRIDKQLVEAKTQISNKQKKLRSLEQQLEKKDEDFKVLYSNFQKQKENDSNKLKVQIQQSEQKLKFKQAQLKKRQQVLIQYEQESRLPKQKQYVYVQKIVHSEEGKLATQKYLSLTKQYLTLQSSHKDLEYKNNLLNQSLNHYKQKQNTFNDQRQKWRKQREEMNLRYQEHNKDNFTWNVERIIHAENHGGGIKLENNRKLIPNEHLPHVSYLVVSNEDEFQEHLRNVGESRILRSRSISKSRSKE